MITRENAAAKDPSPEQEAIFHWGRTSRIRFRPGTDGIVSRNLVVRARAGTGKTTTILAMVELVPEQAILLAAFNKSIATELQSRVRNERVEAKTLHGLGFKFVMRNWKGVKVDDNGERARQLAILAIGSDEHETIVKLVSQLHTKAREIEPFAKSARDLLTLASRFDLLPDEEWAEKGWDEDAVCEAAFKAMQLAKQQVVNGVEVRFIDFADMIYLPLANNWVRPWYNMVVIDEAQDMTTAQLALAMRCCKRDGRICVVGDDRQAIYAFRGADSSSLDRLKAELKAEELGLTTTYRCGKQIVALAAKLVPDFKAAPQNGEGEIKNINTDKMLETAAEGDFILSRTNAPLIKVCMALLKRNVRARIKGRDIGKGIIALLRKLKVRTLIEMPEKLAAWVEGEIERATDKLSEEAAAARIEFVTDQAGVLNALAEGLDSVSALEARVTELFADDAEKRAVMCSTVHRAKGLEADHVFLLEGTFRKSQTGEEANIRYVGITRAKSQLNWVSGFETAPKKGEDGEGPTRKRTPARGVDITAGVDPAQVRTGEDVAS